LGSVKGSSHLSLGVVDVSSKGGVDGLQLAVTARRRRASGLDALDARLDGRQLAAARPQLGTEARRRRLGRPQSRLELRAALTQCSTLLRQRRVLAPNKPRT